MYLLDTDILGLYQRKKAPEYGHVRRRVDAVGPAAVYVSIVSFHEQIIGWSAWLHRAKKSSGLVYGYEMLGQTIADFTRLNVLAFDSRAADVFDDLKSRRIRIGSMDLRIAAVALTTDMTVIIRNTVDFERVPGLRIEDWTLPPR